MQWHIHKTSRSPGAPYSGPACACACVIPGKVYSDKEEAERDAVKLTECNPVGFQVSPYSPQVNLQPRFNRGAFKLLIRSLRLAIMEKGFRMNRLRQARICFRAMIRSLTR